MHGYTLTISRVSKHRIAIHLQVELNEIITNGDRVAFIPAVAGG